MSSPPPLAYDTYYHIYNRGNNGENLFKQERNYPYFLKLYAKHIEPIAFTFAYCLLPNHFHVLVRIKSEDEIEQALKDVKTAKLSKPMKPSQQFSNFFNAYSKAINNAYQRSGSLFEHPFGRKVVDSDAYFTQLVIYIHRNPQWHKLVPDFRDWPYSSYHTLFTRKPTHLERGIVIDWFDGIQNIETHHQSPINMDQIGPLIGDDFD